MSSLKYWDGTQWVSVSVDSSNYTTTVQSNLTAHTSLTNAVHGSTSSATPNRLVQRDGTGGAQFGGTLTASALTVTGGATIISGLTLSSGNLSVSTGTISASSSITSSGGSLVSGSGSGVQGGLNLYSSSTGSSSILRSQNTSFANTTNYLPTNASGELMLASGANATASPNYLNSFYNILTSDKVFYGPSSPTISSYGSIFGSVTLSAGTYFVDGTLYWQVTCTSGSFTASTSAYLYSASSPTGIAINYSTTSSSVNPPSSLNGASNITGLITAASTAPNANTGGYAASFTGSNTITVGAASSSYVSSPISGVITIPSGGGSIGIITTATSSTGSLVTYHRALTGSYLRVTPITTLPTKGTWT